MSRHDVCRLTPHALSRKCTQAFQRWTERSGSADLTWDPFGQAEKYLAAHDVLPAYSHTQARQYLRLLKPVDEAFARAFRWIEAGFPIGTRFFWGDLAVGLPSDDFIKQNGYAFIMFDDWLAYGCQCDQETFEGVFDRLSNLDEAQRNETIVAELERVNEEHARVWITISFIMNWIDAILVSDHRLCKRLPADFESLTRVEANNTCRHNGRWTEAKQDYAQFLMIRAWGLSPEACTQTFLRTWPGITRLGEAEQQACRTELMKYHASAWLKYHDLTRFNADGA